MITPMYFHIYIRLDVAVHEISKFVVYNLRYNLHARENTLLFKIISRFLKTIILLFSVDLEL
jgi:hypothetical protein